MRLFGNKRFFFSFHLLPREKKQKKTYLPTLLLKIFIKVNLVLPGHLAASPLFILLGNGKFVAQGHALRVASFSEIENDPKPCARIFTPIDFSA